MLKSITKTILITITLISILVVSCNNHRDQKDVNEIVVSILPQKTFVKKIVGDNIPIKVLIPLGASPSTYDMKPSQLKSVSNAAVWFRIGHIGFEKTWSSNINEVNTKMKVVDLSKGINLIETPHNHGEEIHIGTDPHIWMSPKNVALIAENIYSELIKLQPENKEKYKQNLSDFLIEINETDESIQQILQDKSTRNFIIFHPSLAYFARDYGLNQYSIEFDGKEPKPKHLKKVIDLAKEKNIKVIFIQKEFDKEMARTIAQEINGEVVVIDPLSEDWSNNLIEIAKSFAKN